jgi:hypothetical protein
MDNLRLLVEGCFCTAPPRALRGTANIATHPLTGYHGGMQNPKCSPFLAAAKFKRTVVQSIEYDGPLLVIKIKADEIYDAQVIFRNPVGFRVLDERDLCEFWEHYHEKNGWLYEVEEGGWLELERTRPLFNSHEVVKELREYFLVDEMCISVLAVLPPEISD